MVAKFSRIILFSLTIFLAFVTVLVFLSILLHFVNDSLSRIYFFTTSTLFYFLLFSYLAYVFLRVRLFYSLYHLFRKALKYGLLISFSYTLPYTILKDSVLALILHPITVSLYVASKKNLIFFRTHFLSYKFCDGFLIEGFFVKRVHLIMQVYPSTSQDTVVNRLSRFGEVFLLKYPHGFLMLFKCSSLCISYSFWKRFLQKRFLVPFKDLVPSLCHLRILSCKEMKEFLDRRYVPAKSSLNLKGFSSVDLIYFPRSRDRLRCAFFMVGVGGSNLLLLEKVGVKCFEVDHFTGCHLYLDDLYAFLKSLHTCSRLFEYYGMCPVRANIVRNGDCFRVKILSSPPVCLEHGQLNLQLTLYSLNISMLQKG